MGVFDISKEDIDATRLIKPGWHPFDIKDVTDRASDKDGSMTTFVTFLGVDEHSAGTEVTAFFNEKPSSKRMSGVVQFIKAMLESEGGKQEPGQFKIDTSLHGRRIDVFITNTPDERTGRMKNNAADYRPHKAA